MLLLYSWLLLCVFVAAAGGGVPAAYYFRAVVLLGLLCCCPLFVVSLLLEGVVIGKGGKNKIKHQYQPKLYPHLQRVGYNANTTE